MIFCVVLGLLHCNIQLTVWSGVRCLLIGNLLTSALIFFIAGRVMLGATNPADSAPGTIRGDMCIHVGRNICHGSDSVESAEAEIALWFAPEEINSWTHHSAPWVYE